MPNWEFDVISLKTEYDDRDRRSFKWRSCRGDCHEVDQSGLERLLNEKGSRGWSVVSHDTDSRWGSNLILTRAIPDNEQSKKTHKNVNAEPIPPPAPIIVSAPPIDLAPLLAELQALRQEVAEQREQQLMHRPLDATKRLQEEQQQRWAEESSRYLHSEEFKELLAPILEELKAQREPKPVTITLEPVTATLALETARDIGFEVQRAVEMALAPKDPPMAQNTEPKFERKPWFSWSWVTGIGR